MLVPVDLHVCCHSCELVGRHIPLDVAPVQSCCFLGQGSESQLAGDRSTRQHLHCSNSEDGVGASAGRCTRSISEELVGAFEPAQQREISVISALDLDLLLAGWYYLRHVEIRDVEGPGADAGARDY